jgi:Flp pilus assembly protein TadD
LIFHSIELSFLLVDALHKKIAYNRKHIFILMKNFITYTITILTIAISLASCTPDRRSTAEILDAAIKAGNDNHWADALELAKDAARRESKNPAALMMLATAYENNGRKDLAIQAARNAATYAPDNFQAQYLLGRLYFQNPKKTQDALQPLLKALEIKPDDPNTLILVGQIFRKFDMKNPEQYYKRLAKTKRFKNRPEPWNEMGVIYAAKNDPDNAARCLIKAYQAAPNNHTTVLNLAIFMDRHGKKSKAIYFYKKFIELVASNPEMEHQRQRIRRRIRELSS